MTALIDRLYNSTLRMSEKATKGMNSLLNKRLIPPANPNGIISKTSISVTKTDTILTLQTNFPDYAYFVENGRKRGKKPPIKPIKEWCNLHNLPEGVAWHLQKKIGEEGTQGKHFLLPLERMLEMLYKTLNQVSRTQIVSTYNNMVYEGTEILKETKLTL